MSPPFCRNLVMICEITDEVKIQIIQDIDNLYERLTQELATLPSPCTSCGFCCHFDKAQHFLYVSTLEMVYLFDKYELPEVKVDGVCPYLRNNMCSVRDRRMIGCRTYFRLHNKEQTIAAEAIYEKYLLEMKELHRKYGIAWNYQDCMNIFKP